MALNLSGTNLFHFTAALAAVGVGWNFVYIGATTMLTETYTFEERGKAQAANDFVITTGVAISAFFAGTVHHRFGWTTSNYVVIPMIAIIVLLLAWLKIGTRAVIGQPKQAAA